MNSSNESINDVKKRTTTTRIGKEKFCLLFFEEFKVHFDHLHDICNKYRKNEKSVGEQIVSGVNDLIIKGITAGVVGGVGMIPFGSIISSFLPDTIGNIASAGLTGMCQAAVYAGSYLMSSGIEKGKGMFFNMSCLPNIKNKEKISIELKGIRERELENLMKYSSKWIFYIYESTIKMLKGKDDLNMFIKIIVQRILYHLTNNVKVDQNPFTIVNIISGVLGGVSGFNVFKSSKWKDNKVVILIPGDYDLKRGKEITKKVKIEWLLQRTLIYSVNNQTFYKQIGGDKTHKTEKPNPKLPLFYRLQSFEKLSDQKIYERMDYTCSYKNIQNSLKKETIFSNNNDFIHYYLNLDKFIRMDINSYFSFFDICCVLDAEKSSIIKDFYENQFESLKKDKKKKKRKKRGIFSKNEDECSVRMMLGGGDDNKIGSSKELFEKISKYSTDKISKIIKDSCVKNVVVVGSGENLKEMLTKLHKEDVEKVVTNLQLQKCEFHGLDFSGFNIPKGSNFSQSSLNFCKFDECSSMEESNFSKSEMFFVDFQGSKLNGSDFSCSSGFKINFSNSELNFVQMKSIDWDSPTINLQNALIKDFSIVKSIQSDVSLLKAQVDKLENRVESQFDELGNRVESLEQSIIPKTPSECLICLKEWNIPNQVDNFVCRDGLIKKIESKLLESLKSKSKERKQLTFYGFSGMGGVGKTTLAIHILNNSPFKCSFKGWFLCDSIETLKNNYISLGNELKLFSDQKLSTDEKARIVKELLEKVSESVVDSTVLLVYDNAIDYKKLKPLLPCNCVIIITSRSKLMKNLIEINVMEEQESVNLFKSIVEDIDNTFNEEKIKVLVNELGNLPLAVTMAGSYILNYPDYSIEDYLKLYRSGEDDEDLLNDEDLINEKGIKPVYRTWDMNMKVIMKECPFAFEILLACSYLHPDKIPQDLFLNCYLNNKYVEKKEKERKKLFSTAKRYIKMFSLMKIDENKKFFFIHRIVQRVMQMKMKIDKVDSNNFIIKGIFDEQNENKKKEVIVVVEEEEFICYLFNVLNIYFDGCCYKPLDDDENDYFFYNLYFDNITEEKNIINHCYSVIQKIKERGLNVDKCLLVNDQVNKFGIVIESCFHSLETDDKMIFDWLINNKIIKMDSKNRFNEVVKDVALRCGCFSIIKDLIDKKVIDVMDVHSFILCCYSGNLNLVKYFVEECKVDVNEKMNDGSTSIMSACQGGKIEIVKFLVEECKVDVNEKDNNGYTSLMCACTGRKIEIVKFLVEECKVDVNEKRSDGYTSLMCACECGKIEIVKYFVEECKVDVNEKMNDGSTSLMSACLGGKIEIVKYFVEVCKVDVNEKDNNGYDCKFYAEDQKHEDIFKYVNEL